jgi:hypothetical protein
LLNSDPEVWVVPLSNRPLVHDLRNDQVDHHVAVELMVDILVLPFNSSSWSVLAVPLS